MARRLPYAKNQLAAEKIDASVSVYFGGSSLTFPDGIEGISVTFPERQNATQGLSGQWIDALGRGIQTISVSGHTGWKPRGRSTQDGREVFMALAKLHKNHVAAMEKQPNNQQSYLLLSIPSQHQTYRCFATTLRVMQDKSRPLLFQFGWDLTIVTDLYAGADRTHTLQASDYNRHGHELVPTYQNKPREARSHTAKRTTAKARTTAPSKMVGLTVGRSSGTSGLSLVQIIARLYGRMATSQRDKYTQTILNAANNRRWAKNPQAIIPDNVTIMIPKVGT